MATVITNLLSAIPFFGHDLVESNYNFNTEIINTYIQYGENNFILESYILPTVGVVSRQALKKGKILRLNKNEYVSIPTQFISFLVGLIDGDGYIQITRTTKGFIAMKLTIALNINDVSTLEYIHSVLKIGKITIYPDNRNPICKLIVNKTDLQEVLFPLLKHHNIFFLTETRRTQFDLAMYILENDVKIFENIPNSLRPNNIYSLFKLPESPLGYLQLHFFKNWLVGFTNAEGSFFIKKNKCSAAQADGCFQLKQQIHVQLFEAFKLLFNTQRKIGIEKEKYLQFSVSSKADIQKVIGFFSFSGLHPLIGFKNIQYFKWLAALQSSSRYNNLNFPK